MILWSQHQIIDLGQGNQKSNIAQIRLRRKSSRTYILFLTQPKISGINGNTIDVKQEGMLPCLYSENATSNVLSFAHVRDHFPGTKYDSKLDCFVVPIGGGKMSILIALMMFICVVLKIVRF